MTIEKIVLIGDPTGLRQLLAVGAEELILRTVAIVGAGIRPSQHAELSDIAHTGNWPLLIQPRPKDCDYPQFVEEIGALAPDLMIINSYSMLMREDVLCIPMHGAVNFHGAPLPECRGANAVEWSLIEDRWLAGVTAHMVDKGVDTGPILARRLVPVSFTDTWKDIRRRTERATDKLLVDVFPEILSGRFNAVEQDERLARNYSRRHPEDGQFDWSWQTRRIYNLVRALVSPHPGAFALSGTGRVTLSRFLPIGEVARLKFSKHCGKQSCGSGRLRVQPSGACVVTGSPVLGRSEGVMVSLIGRVGAVDFGQGQIVGANWQRGIGHCFLACKENTINEARALLKQFAADELGLGELSFEFRIN